MLGLILTFLLALMPPDIGARLQCEIKFYENRLLYNISDDVAYNIVMPPGRTPSNMQVFHCYCPTPNEFFDDTELSNVDRDFYRINEYDYTQSSIFQIHNCVTLTLSLKSGRGTFSYQLRGKLLLIENIERLMVTAFTVGAPSYLTPGVYNPSGTNEDDTFASIYFRNVTFYQIPPYFEFDDRFEVLFGNVSTDEGSNKVEPFDIRAKNTNGSRNSIFRMENSRFGGVNLITDGYTFNIFTLNIQNLQKASNTSCNYDFKGSIRLIGNSFGYLRSRNIYITNGNEFVFDNNYIDTLNINTFDLTSLKQLHIRNNIFGYQLLDPTINLAYYRGGSGSCSVQDLPESSVGVVEIINNRVQRLETTFMNVIADPNYSQGFVNKINMADNTAVRYCLKALGHSVVDLTLPG